MSRRWAFFTRVASYFAALAVSRLFLDWIGSPDWMAGAGSIACGMSAYILVSCLTFKKTPATTPPPPQEVMTMPPVKHVDHRHMTDLGERGPGLEERIAHVAMGSEEVTTLRTMARATCLGDDANGMGMSLECMTKQAEFEGRLRGSDPAVTRAILRFIDRPTADDLIDAVQLDFFIVIRVHIPERWRKECKPDEGLLKVTRRCRSILNELGLIGGNPRVFLIADSCDAPEQFRQKVYERFGA